MSKKTEEEIAAEIARLEEAKQFAPKRTMFGDDNHEKIDRQIEYLRGDIDIDAPEWDDFSQPEQSAIMEAQAWADGQSDEVPSEGWEMYRPKADAKKPKKAKR